MNADDFTSVELDALRRDFPIVSRKGRGGTSIAYFDSSATSQKPETVIDAEAEFYRYHNGAVHRGTHVLSDESTSVYEDGRTDVARFIGARPDEIVWTKNATEALNLVAMSIGNASNGLGGKQAQPLSIGVGDRIVVTRAEHHSNLVPWQQLCKRTGAELSWLDLHADGSIDLGTLNVITANTRLVAFTHASNVTGAITDVAAIVAAARAVGALTVLDTCQSVAHMPIDVAELGVDFIVLSSHKMLGPTGIGALWGRRELLEIMPPVLTGGSTVVDVAMDSTEFLPAPEKFEAGSQPVGQIAGWSMALDYLRHVGMDRLAEHEALITRRMLEGLSDIDGVQILGSTNPHNRLAVVAFTIEGVHPHDVGQYLDSQDIAVRVGHHCAIPLHRHFGVRSSTRASASLTTTIDDVDRLIEAVRGVRPFFVKGSV